MSEAHNSPDAGGKHGIAGGRLLLLAGGPGAMLLLLSIPAPDALNTESWRLLALLSWMVLWWMSEAVPVAVTALLPIPMMPLLGIASQRDVAANYGDPLIYLYLGGFLLAAAMQRWGLHRRIALLIVSRSGGSPAGIVGGFMIATAFLSMWISNTATAVMMLAVGVSMIDFVGDNVAQRESARSFGVALMLGIAYSASIGGVATLIGTPPNTLMASYLAQGHGVQIDFAAWMKVGIPITLLMLPLTWLLLCRLFPIRDIRIEGAAERVREQLAALGHMGRGERIVLVVFALTALAWIMRSLLVALSGFDISDTTIALVAAIALFAIPASAERGEFTLDWSVAKSLPWGVLLLFGGGLAIAEAFSSSGLADSIAAAVAAIGTLPAAGVLLIVIATIVYLTEITSNTATAATFLPLMGAVAVGLGRDPVMFAVPVALAASMAFMMPVATPPNAIVFSYEGLHIADMMKAGFWLNLIAIAVIWLAMMFLLPVVL